MLEAQCFPGIRFLGKKIKSFPCDHAVINCLLSFWLIATFAASSDWVRCWFEGSIYYLILQVLNFAIFALWKNHEIQYLQNLILTKIKIVKFNTRYIHIHKIIIKRLPLSAVVYVKNVNSVFTVVRLKWPLHIKNRQIAKSNMLQFYLAPKIAKLKTRKKKAHDFCMKFITHKIKWEQGTNIFYCFASLWHFIKGSFNQVNKLWYVKHITVKKKN